MTNPSAGEEIASRWAVVILGGRKPLFVDFTSSMAELSGGLLSELIPTCAMAPDPVKSNNAITIETVYKNVFMSADFE